MEIRDATFIDSDAIAVIHFQSWLQTYSRVLTKSYLENEAPKERKEFWQARLSSKDQNQKIFIAESQGQIIGFACGIYGEGKIAETYLDNLHVVAEFRSKGAGKALLLNIASWAMTKSEKAGLCLLVNQTNENAQAFYLRHGAENHSAGVWNAPDGSVVPTYWFNWDSVQDLVTSKNTSHGF